MSPDRSNSKDQSPAIDLPYAAAVAAGYQICLLVVLFAFLKFTGRGWTPFRLRELFTNWDARHYIRIAMRGYETKGDAANAIVYFPLYPWLVRPLTWLMPPAAAGVVVSNLASFVGHAAFLLFLGERGYRRKEALRVMTLLFLSPVAIYFTLVYTEGLLLCTTALFLLALERRMFRAAAIAGMCAAMTKFVGVLLVILFYSAYFQRKKDDRSWLFLLWGCFIPAGYLVYAWLNYYYFGNAFQYLIAQEQNWYKSLANPIVQYANTVSGIVRGIYFPSEPLQQTISWDYVVPVLVPPLLVLHVTRFRKSSSVALREVGWSAAQILLFLSQSFWLSTFRYLALVLPLYMMIEEMTRRSSAAFVTIAGLFGAGLLYCCYVFTTGWWLL